MDTPGVARRKGRAARTLLVRTALSRWVPDRFVSQRSAATSAPREEAYFFFFLAFFLGAFLAAFFRFLATVRPPKKVSARSVSVTSKSLVCSERVLPETKPKFLRAQALFNRGEKTLTRRIQERTNYYLYTIRGIVQHETCL